jgi:hypothetical protein
MKTNIENNALLASLPPDDRAFLEQHAVPIELHPG